MHRSLRTPTLLLATAVVLVLSGCGMFQAGRKAADVADHFYNTQIDPETPIPVDIFADESVERDIRARVAQRDAVYGPCRSYRRIGSNRRVEVRTQGRIETATFVYEVSCESGQTRETLVLTRGSTAEAFVVTEYSIEDVHLGDDPSPAGTSST